MLFKQLGASFSGGQLGINTRLALLSFTPVLSFGTCEGTVSIHLLSLLASTWLLSSFGDTVQLQFTYLRKLRRTMRSPVDKRLSHMTGVAALTSHRIQPRQSERCPRYLVWTRIRRECSSMLTGLVMTRLSKLMSNMGAKCQVVSPKLAIYVKWMLHGRFWLRESEF